MSRFRLVGSAVVALAWVVMSSPTHALDMIKVAAGQRGNWDTTISEVGQRLGIFKKHGHGA